MDSLPSLTASPLGVSGDDSRFVEFAAARWHTLVRSAVLLRLSPASAEDVVQEVLARCFLRWSAIERSENVDAYVYKMLLNAVRARQRRFWRNEVPTADLIPTASPLDIADEVLRRSIIRLAVSSLPRKQREVLVLRYHVDMTDAAVADVLGIPIGTVKSRMHRAIETLRENTILKEYYE